MIKEITEIGFNSGVTLNSATVNLTNMGERTITADVKIAGGAALGDDAELTFRGERFVPIVKDPQAVKNNERVAHVVSVTFQSYVIAELKRYWFFKTPEQGSDIIVDTYKYQIGLNLSDFVVLFNQVLSHYYGEEIVMDATDIDMSEHTEAELIDIDYTTIWSVLTQIYEKYKVRWKIAQSNGVYTIVLSNEPDTLQHVFSYGYEGGLTSIERQVQNEEIHNKIFGRGVDTNLPPFYFKRLREGDTSGYQSDPDALYELKYIEFTELRDAVFRWYVRGWMQNDNRDRTWENNEDPLYTEPYFYPTYQESDIPAQPVELHDSCLLAFRAGKTDEVFNPIEYVKDDTSIARYGELWGKAEPDEDVYPTIKTPIVAYENTTPDEVKAAAEQEAKQQTLPDSMRYIVWLPTTLEGGINGNIGDGDSEESYETRGEDVNKEYKYTWKVKPFTDNETRMSVNAIITKPFVVPTGMKCTPSFNLSAEFGQYVDGKGIARDSYDSISNLVWHSLQAEAVGEGYQLDVDKNFSFYYVKDAETGEYLMDGGVPAVSPLIIPAGEWQIEFHPYVIRTGIWVRFKMDDTRRSFRIVYSDVHLDMGVAGASPYRLFDIWIGNTWNTQKGEETDEEYVRRIWAPILGTSQEAAVYFTTGMLARSSDYNFKIAGPLLRGVAYDTSKTGSHWRLTLVKSEAEYQADGMFIPREGIEPVAGDLIAFTDGTIVYPHTLIEDAEQRINAHKIEVLKDYRDIQPAWAVKLDKVRINTLASGEAATLYSQIDVGRKITISSETLIPDGDHTRSMFIESMTITWGDDTIAKPDVDITLSGEIRVYHSPIQTLHADIREVEVTKIDEEEAEQTSRRVAARESIPSTGAAPAKGSAPMQFANALQSENFQQGIIEGLGWGIYRNLEGDYVLEADRLNIRRGITTVNIEVDEWKHQGGVQILSAANMRISKIETKTNAIRCYFDSQNNSVPNLFVQDDIVLCNKTDTGNGAVRSYRYLVTGIGRNYVTLSTLPSGHIGDAAAVGDELIQFGNTTDVNRQHVIIFDAASGHERMLFGLNSISATGDVYYYAGAIQQSGTERRRWFVGDRDNSKENFIEYAWNETTQSYALIIGGDVYVGGSDVSLDALNYLAAALRDGGQAGGLILSNQIAVYTGTGAQAQVMGGINGAANAENIAAWFGGAMTTEGQTAAKVVFKFDGSGYVAAKHISWDAAGNCTIDGTVQLSSGGTVGDLLTLVQGAIQKTQVASKGTHKLPVYFDQNGNAQEIDALRVPGNIEATNGGVSAGGIADLTQSQTGGGGGGGDVHGVRIGNGTAIGPDAEGIVPLPAYPTWNDLKPQGGITENDLSSGLQDKIERAVQPDDLTPITNAIGTIESKVEDNTERISDLEDRIDAMPEVVEFANLNPDETESTGKVATAKSVAILKDRIGVEELDEYDPTRDYYRGEVVKVTSGGIATGYRFKLNTPAGTAMAGRVEKLTYKTLANPLNIVGIENILV